MGYDVSGMTKVLVSLLLIVACLGAAVASVAILKRTAPTVAQTPKPIPAQLVETVELAPQDRTDWIDGYGTARPYQIATVTAEVNAAVTRRVDDLRAGMEVRGTQILIRLDDRQYQEQFQAAQQMAAADAAALQQLVVEQANLEKLTAIAQEQVDITVAEQRRVGNLHKEGNAAESEYNRVRLACQQTLQNLQGLQNQLALLAPRRAGMEASRAARLNEAAVARLNVERCEIRAPFDGRIDQIMVEVGDAVRVGSPIARILTPDHLEVPLEIATARCAEVTVGAECSLTVDAMPGVRWNGTIERIAPAADERARTVKAYAVVRNADQDVALLPGMFVRAEIEGRTLRDVLLVPRATIVDGQVFVALDGHARRRRVRVERLLRDLAVVSGEVSAGDRVIVTNLDVLFDGAPIRTAGATESAAAL